MQTCTHIQGSLWSHARILVHKIFIHHPAEGEGDHEKEKSTCKENQTICETVRRKTNKASVAVTQTLHFAMTIAT